MKNRVYIFVIFVTLTFAVFTQSDFTRFLLGFEFLLWIALFVWTRLLRRCIDKTMCPPPPQAARGQELPLEVQLKNRCGLPVSEIQVELKCGDDYTGEVQRLRGTAMLDGRDEATLRFVLQARHYGLLTVWAEKIKVGDPLGVNYAASHFTKQMWKIAVLPELTDDRERQSASEDAKHPVEDGGESDARGEDPSAAYELRAYQTGEPLRNVHWKMTAKTGEMMVKEFVRDTEPMTLVFLDLDRHGRPYSRKEWDAFLEEVASFSAAQLQAGNHFEMLWVDGQYRRCQMPVRSDSDAQAALTALLREKPRSGTVDEIAYKEIITHEACNAAVCIDLWCKVTRAEAAR